MFLDELTPVVRELGSHPMAFLGGFFSGLFRLNLSEDPVKSWLHQQTGMTGAEAGMAANGHKNGRSQGPQSISIE